MKFKHFDNFDKQFDDFDKQFDKHMNRVGTIFGVGLCLNILGGVTTLALVGTVIYVLIKNFG